uniref:Uncharacterized protein n=1 Tax=Ditylenchus dipsaci TaxID=166011 RepID=A0A915CTQ5_9BILA
MHKDKEGSQREEEQQPEYIPSPKRGTLEVQNKKSTSIHPGVMAAAMSASKAGQTQQDNQAIAYDHNVSKWCADARRQLKMETKMTWSPRNCRDDDDKNDNDDDNFHDGKPSSSVSLV